MQHHAFTKESLIDFLQSIDFKKEIDQPNTWSLDSVSVQVEDHGCNVFWKPAGWKRMHFGGYSKSYIQGIICEQILQKVMYS